MTSSIPPSSTPPDQPPSSLPSVSSSSFSSVLGTSAAPPKLASTSFAGPKWNQFNNSANQAFNSQIQQAKAGPSQASPQAAASTITPQAQEEAAINTATTPTTPAPLTPSGETQPSSNIVGGLNLSGPGWEAFDAQAKKMFAMQLEQSMTTQIQKDQAAAHKAAQEMKKQIEEDDN